MTTLLPTPDTLAAIVAQPPPPLSLADRLADLATVRRLFPALSPECDELEALLRRGVVA
ncbi:hypothetical protein [Streptomyces aculeolatus]|uniref:hypothetical protein n=1 Tax=Streptomyces aculeolatus TaxID=270689 RepID=UPI001CEC6C61|nr:hypothetical protein [Streptomyces aculeolatus]